MEVVQESFWRRSFLFCSVLVVRKALLSPFMTSFINNRQSGMSSLTLNILMICSSIVKNLINFLPLDVTVRGPSIVTYVGVLHHHLYLT